MQRDGIRFQGLHYQSPTLAGYVGKTMTIRYDPRDITEIRVFHNDQFVCKAVDPDHNSSTLSLKEIQAARSALVIGTLEGHTAHQTQGQIARTFTGRVAGER